MNKSELQTALEAMDLHPSRKLGQSFLIDPNLLEALVRDVAPVSGESILEVGPGTGTLTEALLNAGARVVAVELDHRLAGFLRERLGGHAGFQLVEADACRVDVAEIMGTETFRCVSNLPYSAGSVVIVNLCELPHPPVDVFVMVQLEVARRLVATAGTADYGLMTVRVQAVYEAEILRRISPKVFWPTPAVQSAFIRLRRRRERPGGDVAHALAVLVRHGFGQRRKQLRTSLKPVLGARLEEYLAGVGAEVTQRAESLSVEQWMRLAERTASSGR